MEIYERNRTIKREKFVVHIWRTRGAQNHEMCATAIKGYKKHMP